MAITKLVSDSLGAGVGGKVGQVVSSILDTTVTTTSQTFTDTGLSVSITPSSTSSKVLVLVTLGSLGMSNLTLLLNLVRGSTNIAQPASGTNAASIQHYTVNAATATSQNLTFLDSPATTSATTYKMQWRKDGSSTGYLNRHVNSAEYSAVSTITAMEILA